MKRTVIRKATCFHVSDADKMKCPLCGPKIPTRKRRAPKYMMLYGYRVSNIPTTFAEALALSARLKKAAAKRAKSTKRSAK